MGVWRIRSKNGVQAERKPVELGSQVWRQKGERLKVGVCVCIKGDKETGRDREETPEERNGSNVWRMLRTQRENL